MDDLRMRLAIATSVFCSGWRLLLGLFAIIAAPGVSGIVCEWIA